MKHIKISFLVILLVSLMCSAIHAEDWTEKVLPITPGSGIDTDTELDLAVEPMTVSYATVIKRGKVLKLIVLLKNTTDSVLEVSSSYRFEGYHDGERIFRRGMTTGFPKIAEPGDYFITTATYEADGKKTISFINKVGYSHNFSLSNESYSDELKIVDIFRETGMGMLQIEIRNTSEEKIFDGSEAAVQLFFINEQGKIVGWKRFLNADAVVPGGKRISGGIIGMGAVLSKEYAIVHDYLTEIKDVFIEEINSGKIKVKATGIPSLSKRFRTFN